MTVRFQADADLNQIIVVAVQRRYPEIDFRTAASACLGSAIPRFWPWPRATDACWSRTTRTRCRVISESSSPGCTSPGMIVVPQYLAVGQVAEELALIWGATSPEEWTDRIAYLPI